ncbi:hypothetical protein D3C78_1671710 [compost metagenome]
MQFGRSSSMVEVIVNQVYDASEGMGDTSLLYAQIAKLLLEKNEPQTKNENVTNRLPKKSKTHLNTPIKSTDDIRYIVAEGHKKGLTSEEALEQKGYIREVDELLNFIS